MPWRESRLWPWWDRRSPQTRVLLVSILLLAALVAVTWRTIPWAEILAPPEIDGGRELLRLAAGVDRPFEIDLGGARLRLAPGAVALVARGGLAEAAAVLVRLLHGDLSTEGPAAAGEGRLLVLARSVLAQAPRSGRFTVRTEEAAFEVEAEAGEVEVRALDDPVAVAEGEVVARAAEAIYHPAAGAPRRWVAADVTVEGGAPVVRAPAAEPFRLAEGDVLAILGAAPEPPRPPGLVFEGEAGIVYQAFRGPAVRLRPGETARGGRTAPLFVRRRARGETLPPTLPRGAARYVAASGETGPPAAPASPQRNWSRLPRPAEVGDPSR